MSARSRTLQRHARRPRPCLPPPVGRHSSFPPQYSCGTAPMCATSSPWSETVSARSAGFAAQPTDVWRHHLVEFNCWSATLRHNALPSSTISRYDLRPAPRDQAIAERKRALRHLRSCPRRRLHARQPVYALPPVPDRRALPEVPTAAHPHVLWIRAFVDRTQALIIFIPRCL